MRNVLYRVRVSRIITIVAAVAVCRVANAQYDPSFSHYFDMEALFNPAAVGKDPVINAVGAYNISMAGFERNPQTAAVAVDMPFRFVNRTHGAGVQLVSDNIGLFNHQKLSLQYAFQAKLFGGTISAGVQAGFLSEKLSSSEIDLEDSSDPAFASADASGAQIDFAAGVYWRNKSWYVGASAQHLAAPTVKIGETNELEIDRTYYLTCGYNIKLRNPLLSVRASALGRTDLKGWRADATARLVYTHDKKVMYCGLAYSPAVSATVLVGGSFHGVMLGYSYEAYTNGINLANGSHELFVGYKADIDLGKKGRNKHQSVRLL